MVLLMSGYLDSMLDLFEGSAIIIKPNVKACAVFETQFK